MEFRLKLAADIIAYNCRYLLLLQQFNLAAVAAFAPVMHVKVCMQSWQLPHVSIGSHYWFHIQFVLSCKSLNTRLDSSILVSGSQHQINHSTQLSQVIQPKIPKKEKSFKLIGPLRHLSWTAIQNSVMYIQVLLELAPYLHKQLLADYILHYLWESACYYFATSFFRAEGASSGSVFNITRPTYDKKKKFQRCLHEQHI